MHLLGSTQAEIQYHYDTDDAFYRLWLGDEQIYSCALWEQPDASLEKAQRAKLQYHLQNLHLPKHANLLDIGCGWGALLHFATKHFEVDTAIGLTLSQNQCQFIRSIGGDGVEVRLEHWLQHKPKFWYDGIVSIGALEHFTRPEDSTDQKRQIYRRFFESCSQWLCAEGRLSLQTIAYGSMDPSEASEFMQKDIFPGSELPRQEELLTSAKPYFTVVQCCNHHRDYAKTCECWLRNLQRHRDRAHELVGKAITAKYERYLRLSAIGFKTGRLHLLRIVFQKSNG